MASLRKKPADVAAASAPEPLPATVNSDATPPPAQTSAPTPALATPQTDGVSEALRSQLELLKQAETMQQQSQIAQLAAETRRRSWFELTPAAKENHAALNPLHHAALDAGLADTSPEYFNFMETQLAALQRPATATHLAEEMQQRAAQARASEPPLPVPRSNGSFVSAPVSREVPSANGKRQSGKITLTREEQEFAKVSGVTLEEYAKQKQRLENMKESGEYRDQR